MYHIDGGFRIIYEREAPLDIRITDPRIIAAVGQDVGSRETVTFKIMIKEPTANQQQPHHHRG